MIYLPKRIFNNYKKILIAFMIKTIVVLIIVFELSIFESALLALASPFLLFLLLKFGDPFFKKVLCKNYAAMKKEADHLEFHQNLARKEGKKSFEVGPNKMHVVWAKDPFGAQKTYKLRIHPLIEKHPKKEFYFVSKACNNLIDV